MSHPYEDKPNQSFWRTGVVTTDRLRWPDLYRPKVALKRGTMVATAGSCFAQHIGRGLKGTGVAVVEAELRPEGMSRTLGLRYGFDLFSARYGNIYTARQMRELLEDAIAGHVDPRLVMEKEGRFFDALRPGVEPEGCDSVDEVLELRREHLKKVAALMSVSDVLIFTLGLTESWHDVVAGRTLALAPGVIAGAYDPARYAFHNFTCAEVVADLNAIRHLAKTLNPAIKLILTVSPVPLTATASEAHVLSATSYSKSVLRAAAGECVTAHEDVDYFPSYEIVTTWANPQEAFAPNLRSVRDDMVARVMAVFLSAHGLVSQTEEVAPTPAPVDDDSGGDDGVVCEEALLEALRS